MNLRIRNPVAHLPLLGEFDLLVVGGGLAGLPAARRLAQAGRRVLLVEQGTFLGYEIGAWQRPWFHWRSEEAVLAQEWLPLEEVRSHQPGETIPLHMDRLKRRLEDRLLRANQIESVRLLYGTLPVSCRRLEHGWQVVFGNKSGRQVALCRSILDTSETQVIRSLLEMAGESGEAQDLESGKVPSGTAHRTLEFTRVESGWARHIAVPPESGVLANRVELFPGAYDDGHVLVDIPLPLAEPTRSLEADAEVEFRARKVSLEVGAYLVHNIPQFAHARLGWGSLRVMRRESFDPLGRLRFGETIAEKLLSGAYGSNPCLLLDAPDLDRQMPRSTASQDESLEYREHSEFNLLRRLPVVEVESPLIPQVAQAEVLVAGGGTSGAVAGIAAAQAGSQTLVVEMNGALGGTATLGGVSFYWFGYRTGFTHQVDRRVWWWTRRLSYPRENYVWGRKDSWSHELRTFALLEMAREAGARVFFNCLVTATLMQEEEAVAGVVLATPYGPAAVRSRVTVDATGDGDVAAFAGADFVYGNERDRMTMWAALAWYRAPGVYQGGSFATTVDVSDIEDWTRFILVGRRRGSPALYDHASYLAPRESRHILGEVVLTLQDQLLMRKFPDTISLCFSNHDPKGRSTADLVYFGVLPPHLEIPIPYRALLPKRLENLLVTGKAFSCSHDALAATRMIDDLQNQGGAAGLAAALSVHSQVSPRQLNVQALQARLVEADMLPSHVLEEPPAELPVEFAALIDKLTGEEPLEWLEMGVKERLLEPSPVVVLCTAPSESVLPLLQQAYRTCAPAGPRRLLLARLLLWHSDELGLDDILAEITCRLEEDPPLPRRKGSIRWCQLYPDHGVMAEVTYLVNLLARAHSPKVVACLEELGHRIEHTRRDYTDMRQCMFNYIESIAYVAERVASPALIPLLERLLTLFELSGRLHTHGLVVDLVDERLAYLVICLSRALVCCGSRTGLRTLAEFTADNRISLARCARDELAALTGADHGNQPWEWMMALRDWPDRFSPIPWERRIE